MARKEHCERVAFATELSDFCNDALYLLRIVAVLGLYNLISTARLLQRLDNSLGIGLGVMEFTGAFRPI